MEKHDLYEELKKLSPEELNKHYESALQRFLGRLRGDPNVIAAILVGSLAYDKVWYKSDMDMAVLVRDQKLDGTGYSLDEDGIVINMSLYTRTGFKQAMQRSKGGDFGHSMYAKAKVVYTTDDSLYEFLDDVREMGADDKELTFFNYSAWLLGLMEKVEKWIVVKDNPMYAQFYILKCAENLADMRLILEGLPPNRESVIRALELDPEFMRPFYELPMTQPLKTDEVYETLERMTRFLEDHMEMLSAPAIRYLEDGEVKTASMLGKHFGNGAIYHTFDFLAEYGVVERVTQTIRITPKGKKNVEEVAYLYIGDAFQ